MCFAIEIWDVFMGNVIKDYTDCLERGLGCVIISLLRNNFVNGNEDEILSDVYSALL